MVSPEFSQLSMVSPEFSDYLENTHVAADEKGTLESVSLTIPKETNSSDGGAVGLPKHCAAVLILDAFPMATHILE